jgi:hypothetical protein
MPMPKGHKFTKEQCEKLRHAQIKRYSDPEERKKASIIQKEIQSRPERMIYAMARNGH